MIRPCTEADIPFVMELGRKFADELLDAVEREVAKIPDILE